jgi:hypothetical protein
LIVDKARGSFLDPAIKGNTSSMLGIEFKKLYSVSHASQQILLFECSLSQREIRTSNVFNFDFQLWHRPTLSSGLSRFISPLYLDHQSEITDLQPNQEKLFRLFWPYSDEQLEYLDGRISGERPAFEIKGRLLVQSQYPASGNVPPRSYIQWESFFSPPSFSGALFVEQDPAKWAELLTILNYRPRVYRDVSMLHTPGFRRAKERIQNAWTEHRTGDHDGALQSCFTAFESLGFYLYGQPDLNMRRPTQENTPKLRFSRPKTANGASKSIPRLSAFRTT